MNTKCTFHVQKDVRKKIVRLFMYSTLEQIQGTAGRCSRPVGKGGSSKPWGAKNRSPPARHGKNTAGTSAGAGRARAARQGTGKGQQQRVAARRSKQRRCAVCGHVGRQAGEFPPSVLRRREKKAPTVVYDTA